MTETYARTEVTVQNRQTDPPADNTVHVIYHHHSDEGGTLGAFDPQGHAQNVNLAFQHGTQGGSHFQTYLGRGITTKVYNMSDTKPRPIRGMFVYTPTSWESVNLAPREIAVPLRYFASRNIVHQRGRIFIGPWDLTNISETITSFIANQLLDLGVTLAAIGGANASWVVHSEKQDLENQVPAPGGGTTPAAYHDITECWVNDQWAHVTSREHVELSRWTHPITPGLP